MKLSDRLILIRGAGEMASGVAWRLFQSHFKVLLTEVPEPLAVRRTVSFCEAVYEGRQTVEGVEAVLIQAVDQAGEVWRNHRLPLLIDPDLSQASIRNRFQIIIPGSVDALQWGNPIRIKTRN